MSGRRDNNIFGIADNAYNHAASWRAEQGQKNGNVKASKTSKRQSMLHPFLRKQAFLFYCSHAPAGSAACCAGGTKQLKSHVRSQSVCHLFRLFRPATMGMALRALAAVVLTKSNGTQSMRSIRKRRRESVPGRTTAQSSVPLVRNEETRSDMESDEKNKRSRRVWTIKVV
jgi:hypothetical protein